MKKSEKKHVPWIEGMTEEDERTDRRGCFLFIILLILIYVIVKLCG